MTQLLVNIITVCFAILIIIFTTGITCTWFVDIWHDLVQHYKEWKWSRREK